jgi:DNA processing protein
VPPRPTDLPARIAALLNPPTAFFCDGPLDDRARVVAVVGTRKATPEAEAFTLERAGALARAGAVVASGGAMGIDAAAHRGAMAAGGRTWVVAPTGPDSVYPPEHVDLYAQVTASGGAMIWPFERDTPLRLASFFQRNKILVALSDAVVVAQAPLPSGALNAAKAARDLGRLLYVVPAAPWMAGFEGSRLELERGARPLTSIKKLLTDLGLSETAPPPRPAPSMPLTKDERAVLGCLTTTPKHLDEIVVESRLSTQAASTALLTLALEDVVVESPQGLFRRANVLELIKTNHDFSDPQDPADSTMRSQEHPDV